jgi:site-specific DNA-cytosine methylase
MMRWRSRCTRSTIPRRGICRTRSGRSIRPTCARVGRSGCCGPRRTASISPRPRAASRSRRASATSPGSWCAGRTRSSRASSSWRTSRSSRRGDRSPSTAARARTARGSTFKRWVGELKRLGYKVEHRELRACDYGAPTIRKRLFLIARRDGEADRLARADPRRAERSDAVGRDAEALAHGGRDHRLVAAVPLDLRDIRRDHGEVRPARRAAAAAGDDGAHRQGREALRAGCRKALHRQPDASGRGARESVDDPLATVTAAHRGEKAIVTPFVSAAQQGGSVRASADDPLHTVTASAKDQNQIIAPHLMTMRNAHGSRFKGAASRPTRSPFQGRRAYAPGRGVPGQAFRRP